jgi:hypothetical protein
MAAEVNALEKDGPCPPETFSADMTPSDTPDNAAA